MPDSVITAWGDLPGMPTAHRSTPTRLRIKSDGRSGGTRVLIDDVDVSRQVTAVTWSLKAGDLAEATITYYDAHVDVATVVSPDETAFHAHLDTVLRQYRVNNGGMSPRAVSHEIEGCDWYSYAVHIPDSTHNIDVATTVATILSHHTQCEATTDEETP